MVPLQKEKAPNIRNIFWVSLRDNRENTGSSATNSTSVTYAEDNFLRIPVRFHAYPPSERLHRGQNVEHRGTGATIRTSSSLLFLSFICFSSRGSPTCSVSTDCTFGLTVRSTDTHSTGPDAAAFMTRCFGAAYQSATCYFSYRYKQCKQYCCLVRRMLRNHAKETLCPQVTRSNLATCQKM